MEIDQSSQGDITVVRLRGDLELATCREVDQKLRDLLAGQNPKMVIDMKETKYVDSSGLGVLVSLYSHVKKQNGQLAVANLNRSVRRLFDLTNVHNFLPVHASIEDAVRALQ